MFGVVASAAGASGAGVDADGAAAATSAGAVDAAGSAAGAASGGVTAFGFTLAAITAFAPGDGASPHGRLRYQIGNRTDAMIQMTTTVPPVLSRKNSEASTPVCRPAPIEICSSSIVSGIATSTPIATPISVPVIPPTAIRPIVPPSIGTD